MEALPDDQLVAHARKGDGDAFTELARRHQEKVFQTVLWMIKNQQDADVQGQKNASEQIASLFGRKRMKCQQIEQWLSDSVDGPISKKERAIIQAHIETCPACRAFRDRIEQINEEARNLDAPEVSPAESREFSSRLRSALIEIEEEKNKGVLHVFRNKWIFVPASVIMLSLFILIFVFYEKGDFQDEEFYVFSFGNAVEEIYQDMGSDLVLQEAFDSLVSASINEKLITADWDETLNLEDDLLLWEEFSEENLTVYQQANYLIFMQDFLKELREKLNKAREAVK